MMGIPLNNWAGRNSIIKTGEVRGLRFEGKASKRREEGSVKREEEKPFSYGVPFFEKERHVEEIC